jgi:hypothetical protein
MTVDDRQNGHILAALTTLRTSDVPTSRTPAVPADVMPFCSRGLQQHRRRRIVRASGESLPRRWEVRGV